MPETRIEIDTAEIIEAAGRAVEIWPNLRPPERRPGGVIGLITTGGGHGGMMGTATPAVPVQRGVATKEPDEQDRYAPRAEWPRKEDEWKDLRLIEARLTGGADPEANLGWVGTPLHWAAACGSAEVVAELVRHVGDVDLPGQEGFPPLYAAVRHGRLANAAVLLGAGADPSASLGTGGTVGRLALVTPLASLFEGRPDVEPLTDAERAAQDEADRLIRVFRNVDTEGLGAAFVGGLDEEEVIRRLGARPEDCPVLDLEREPGPYGTGPLAFDPYDYPESLRYVGVTAAPGGCVISQPNGYVPSVREVLLSLSRGTVAGGVYFNPKGGRFACVIRDGEVEFDYEFFDPGPDSPREHWLYRFWDAHRGFTRGSELAFLAGSH